MTLPTDYTRCADGPGNCPRANECARAVAPPDTARALLAYLWDALCRERECMMFIERREDR